MAKVLPWRGISSVFAHGMTNVLWTDPFESIESAQWLQERSLAASFELSAVRFLSPGKGGAAPLIQEIWTPKKQLSRNKKRYGDVPSFDKIARSANENLYKIGHHLSFHGPKFVEFIAPFADFFTAGWLYINVKHPTTIALAECISALADDRISDVLDKHDAGRLQDALQPLFGNRDIQERGYLSCQKIEERCDAIRQLFELTTELRVFNFPGEISLTAASRNVPHVSVNGVLGKPILSLQEVGL